jgi:hypothetical protein
MDPALVETQASAATITVRDERAHLVAVLARDHGLLTSGDSPASWEPAAGSGQSHAER